MNVVVVRPSKATMAVIATIGLAAVALAAGMALEGHAVFIAIALFVGGVGLALVVVAVLYLLPGHAFLRVDDAGITVKQGARVETFRWADIERFGVAAAGKNAWTVALRLQPWHPRRSATGAEFDVMLGDVWTLDRAALQALLEERHRQRAQGR